MTSDLSTTAEAHVRAGAAHHAAGRIAEAEAAMREAVRLAPTNVVALANLGAILRGRRRHAEALQIYQAALAIAPNSPDVLTNQANLLNELQRWPQGLESADRAIAGAQDNARAHSARANALAGLGQREEAIVSYTEALRLSPANATSCFNLAKTLLELGRLEDAFEAYRRLAALRPDFAGVQAEMGNAFVQLKRWSEAVAAYDRAFDLNPDLPYLAGQRLHSRMKACDWRDFDRLTTDLINRIDAGRPAAKPFATVTAPLSPRQQLICATTYSNRSFAERPRPRGGPAGERIRIGYFSADFHDHATAYLMAEMLELHDRKAFEITAFSFGQSAKTPIRRRLEAASERFIDIQGLGDEAVCGVARELGLDVAVDLKGFTANSRPQIFATGAAPIQVSFLGYPMTTGAPFIDYLIADRILIGPAELDLYSEKIAWLPGCYQPHDRQRATAAHPTRRADHGLPDDAMVFASFNGSYKITPDVFRIWTELLRAVPTAVLWLMQDDPTASANLRQAATAEGIEPARLIFAPFRPQAEHLERIRHADLFLDSYPCSAHTTASDALWAGLPLLTRAGETFASRVAMSLLTAVGLPELVTTSADEYKATALSVARDRERLNAIRARLAQAKASSPLFDTPTYVRGLEDLYRRMHGRRLAGAPPAHLA